MFGADLRRVWTRALFRTNPTHGPPTDAQDFLWQNWMRLYGS